MTNAACFSSVYVSFSWFAFPCFWRRTDQNRPTKGSA